MNAANGIFFQYHEGGCGVRTERPLRCSVTSVRVWVDVRETNASDTNILDFLPRWSVCASRF